MCSHDEPLESSRWRMKTEADSRRIDAKVPPHLGRHGGPLLAVLIRLASR